MAPTMTSQALARLAKVYPGVPFDVVILYAGDGFAGWTITRTDNGAFIAGALEGAHRALDVLNAIVRDAGALVSWVVT